MALRAIYILLRSQFFLVHPVYIYIYKYITIPAEADARQRPDHLVVDSVNYSQMICHIFGSYHFDKVTGSFRNLLNSSLLFVIFSKTFSL